MFTLNTCQTGDELNLKVLCEHAIREWYRRRVLGENCTGVQRNLIKILD